MTQASLNPSSKRTVERLGLHDHSDSDGGQATETIPPDVAADIHADAIHLKRDEFFSSLPWLLPGALIGSIALGDPRLSWYFLPAVLLAIRPIGLAWEWWRLRREQPMGQFERERQEKADAAAARREGAARLTGVKPVATYGLIGAIVVVTTVEWLTGGLQRSADLAGLVKPAVRDGEWWRLLSSTYLHGTLPHVFGNAISLFLLGFLTEGFDRRWRVPLVYLAAAIGGSVLSTLLDPRTSIGASGGILGLAGYLLVAAGRQPRATRAMLRKSMWRILGATALTGIVGYFFIDNAGHAGGALAGMLVAIAANPSVEASSPRRTAILDLLGWISAAILAAGAIFTIVRIWP